jgi:hypothetical protein
MGSGERKLSITRWLVAALTLASLAGCASNTTFVYKPSAPSPGARKLPLRVAVLPFKDATEDFTKRGNELFDQANLMYNLAKAGVGSTMTALTPELWAKALADDMAASGEFQSVVFMYSRSELKGEDIIVEGAVEKALFSGTWDKPNEFAISLRALRKTGDRPAWEKGVARVWKTPPPGILYDGCRMGPQCMVDRLHADMNKTMQGMFAEARSDLGGTLASLSGSAPATDYPAPGLPAASPPAIPSAESADAEIERILKGN